MNKVVCLLFVSCLTSQQHASVSQGRICADNFTCCHTETEVADQTFYLTLLQYADTGPTSPSADPITPCTWQGTHWSANFKVTGMTWPRKNPGASGIQTQDLLLLRRTPYHYANEAVINKLHAGVHPHDPAHIALRQLPIATQKCLCELWVSCWCALENYFWIIYFELGAGVHPAYIAPRQLRKATQK